MALALALSRVPPSLATTVTTVPGLGPTSALHRCELPQKDFCGAFWAALMLRAGGMQPTN
jgi:hypothetical protein